MIKNKPPKKRPLKKSVVRNRPTMPKGTPEPKPRENDFKIEKDVPLISMPRGMLKGQMPLDQMEIGDSFQVTFDDRRWKSVESMMNSLRTVCKAHKFEFVVRAIDREVARIWRVG